MSTHENMNIDERLKYLRVMKSRYAEGGRKEKGRLLPEWARHKTAPVATAWGGRSAAVA